jgi:hypothetical protein
VLFIKLRKEGVKMKLSKEVLQKALREAKRKMANIYLVESKGEPEIWVNSASANNVRMGTPVIKVLSYGEIEEDNIIYKDTIYSIGEFCELINNQYQERE